MGAMQLDFDFFKTESKLVPKQGRIIISEPFLPGHYFNRSTVLLVEYSMKGAVGFILNKPIDYPVKDVFKDFPDFEADIFIGGPVSNDQLFFIHTLGDKIHGSVRVKENLYWGGDFDHLKSIIRAGLVDHDQIRFFLGYSGWGEGQLDNEIAEHSWLVEEAAVESIMESDENFWVESVSKIGGHYELWQYFPVDPSLN
jgi:putative transcriptional regulator